MGHLVLTLFAFSLVSIGLISFSIFAFAATEQVIVSPRDSETLRFYLEDGDKIRYWISVSGGKNDDVDIYFTNPNGGMINQGRINESFNDEFTASQSGNYYFEFENDFSLVSKKYVNFNYDIIKKPVFTPTSSSSAGVGNFVVGTAWIWLVIIIFAIVIPIAVWRSRKNKTQENFKEEAEYEYREKLEHDDDVQSQNANALRILKERLAKGEISKTEYDKLKKEFV